MLPTDIAWRQDPTSMYGYYSDFCFVQTPEGRKPRYIIRHSANSIINVGEWTVLMYRKNKNNYEPIKKTPFQFLTEAQEYTNNYERNRIIKNRRK